MPQPYEITHHPPHLHQLPTWKSNLLFFGILILIALAYFYWQVRQAHHIFLNHIMGYSSMLTGVIELNVKGAIMSEEIVKEIMQTFLGNTARFVDYLDSVESFSSDELGSFAKEAGLAGIRIVKPDGSHTEGPSNWLGTNSFSCQDHDGLLKHLTREHLYFLSQPREKTGGCIMVGLTAARIEKLHEQVGLPYLLNLLPGRSGILYAKIETHPEAWKPETKIILIDNPDKTVAEIRLPFGNDTLSITIDAGDYTARIRQIRREFIVFSTILAVIGIFLSWLLHRYQNAYLVRIREVERQLARQREDAALGRSAAAITHEIRNPLNAISMGLQRLQIESNELSSESKELVATLLKAVQRTDGIVNDLRRYAKPMSPRLQPVSMASVITHIFSLYRHKIEAQQLQTTCRIADPHSVIMMGDSELLEELVENLMKNSIEAQPNGGYITVCVERRDSDVVLEFENSGFELPSQEAERILDPYFTTKVRGTGLGMAIVSRIVQAHHGKLSAESPEPGVLKIVIRFPAES